MKKLALAMLATAAISMPAMAQNAKEPMAPPSQPQNQQQAQQPGAQKATPQQATPQQAAQKQAAQKQAAQKQPAEEQSISPWKLSRNEIRKLQTALKKDGFKVGKIDGRWGPETRAAVRSFQESKGIKANGQLDEQTISDLGLNGAQFASQESR